MPAQRSRATCCSPRLRYWTLADLLPELTGPLFAQLQRVSAAIAAPGTDGGCAVINNTATQNVPHLHVHVIPRTHRDGLPRTVTMLAYARGHLLLAPHQVGRRGRAGKLHMSAQRDPHHPGGVSAIEHAKPGTTELRTLAAYVEALGGRLEIVADFGD